MISDQASELYVQATKLAPEERGSFLDAQCGDDRALINEIQSLIDAADKAEDYFQGLSDRIGISALAADDEPEWSERVLGPWRLLELLGRGGMGAVYLAERVDDQYQQQVALKLLPKGINTAATHARFLAERQILARLTHPNIARLLDGGIAQDGSPWFAMDYVQGMPIDEYCRECQLGVDERISLLLAVMRAVQYAHGMLVVHRDIKPGNVLIDERGEVRLLDFGIATVLEPTSVEDNSDTTTTRPMTPAYASPEMLRGEPVDVTTDVYSLGVLMYQLLTGDMPLRYADMTPEALYAHAVSTPPVPMTHWQPELAPDLQAITLKALEKFPSARYASVEAMASDLSRFRQNQPINAQPSSFWHRARLFSRRHRLGLSFAAFACLSLLLLVGISVRSAITAEQQAQRIELQRDTAEQTKAFLLSIFELSGPNASKGLTVTARELLDAGAAQIRTELIDQPNVRAELLATLAQIYLELSALPEAAELFVEAGALFEDQALDGTSGLANTLYKRALISEREGDYVGGEALSLEAEAMYRKLGDRANLARSVLTTGRIMQRRGELDAAQARFERALQMHTDLYGTLHVDIARDLVALGTIQMHRGNYDEAMRHYESAREMRFELFGLDDTGRIELAHQLSQVLIFQGELDRALEILRDGVELSQRLLPEGNSGLFYLYNGMADIHRKKGELDRAEENFHAALAVLNRFFDRDHQEHAMVRAQLGRLALVRGDAARAEPLNRPGFSGEFLL